MNKIIILLINFFFISVCHAGYSKKMIIPPFDKTQYNIQKLMMEYEDFSAVFLEKKIISDYDLIEENGKECFSSTTILIIDPQNLRYSTFEVKDKESRTIEDIFLRVISPEGDIFEIKKEDCRIERNDDGTLTYKYAYPNLHRGSIIQQFYTYSTYYYRYQVDQFYSAIPILSYQQDIIIPQNWSLQFRYYQSYKDNIQITNLKKEKKKKYSFTLNNIPAFIDEPFSPYQFETNYYLLSKILGYYQYYADFYFTVHDALNWNQLAKDTQIANLKLSAFPSELDSVLENIEINHSNDLDRAEAVIKYIQENFEYNEDDFINNNASLLNDKKANSFKLTNMADKMAKKLKLNCSFILCHQALFGALDSCFVDRNELRFPAILFEIDQKPYFGFPYMKGSSIHRIPAQFTRQPALIVSGSENDDRVGHFIQIPDNQEKQRLIADSSQVYLLPNGQVRVHQTIYIEEDYMQLLRTQIDDLEEDEKKEFLIELLSLKNRDVSLDQWEIRNVKEQLLPLIIEVDYTLFNLVSINGGDLIFQTADLLKPVSLRSCQMDQYERKNPIFIRQDLQYEKVVEINNPENRKWENPYYTYDLSNKFGKYSFSTVVDKYKVMIKQTTYLNEIKAPKEEYTLLSDLLSEKAEVNLSALFFSQKD